MKLLKLIAILTALMSLFGCENTPPIIDVLDGPGMVYVDSEHRTKFANAISIGDEDDELWRGYSCAVAYLGKDDDRKTNTDVYMEALFKGEITSEQIKQYEFEGDDWFLVIPRYDEGVTITNPGEVTPTEPLTTEDGTPFIIKGKAKVYCMCRYTIDFTSEIDENGKITASSVWDITDLENYNKIEEN